ncbi:MAG TPA: hypothetical protein VFU81_10560 [Thermomicrobiales bacterium]|nr:hypothetical protein [Thermomicrobiales bacterium]
MSKRVLTDRVRRFDDEGPSRRSVLLAAAAALVWPATADDALARSAKKKCAKKGGTWLPSADPAAPCRCARTCSSSALFVTCHRKGCGCFATTEGTGFCGSSVATNGCASSSECGGGTQCVIVPTDIGCSGHPCTSKTDCQGFGAGYACINGTCQGTECANPCR